MKTLGLGLLLVVVSITAACTHKGRLYNLTTGDVTTVDYTYSGSGKGRITAVLKSGEVVQGEYVTVAGGEINWGSVYATVYGPHGTAYGNGAAYSLSLKSKQRGTAIATGDRGTIIQCEYVTSAWSASGYGACKDNHGTLYKLMF